MNVELCYRFANRNVPLCFSQCYARFAVVSLRDFAQNIAIHSGKNYRITNFEKQSGNSPESVISRDMIVNPNAKINLGLHVTEKRPDGFHNIESVFYPVGWTDILEVLPAPASQTEKVRFTSSGIPIPGNADENLVVKAYHLLSAHYPMPAVQVHLHKRIPMGAGLGGGSSDAAFFIRALDQLFELGLAWGELHHFAKQLGSDCSFFIMNRPVFAEGKGDELESITLDLSAYKIAIVHPGIHVSTPEAYKSITPEKKAFTPESIVELPVNEWKTKLVNDFEVPVFKKHPEIAALKQTMYDRGAVYAAMSGSGSAVFGLFETEPDLNGLEGCTVYCGV